MTNEAPLALHSCEVPPQQMVQTTVTAEQHILMLHGSQTMSRVPRFIVGGSSTVQALVAIQTPDLDQAIGASAHSAPSILHDLQAPYPAIMPT
eukprot:CAMPEP_0172747286 /NCGR_PEP_ID=MMETSP1074-20121228/142404_1 /TAXON_ID=2916 /ORGANISM="Ceratium fusus, Strain PA161109" /LENGTH=92 /DNA_ID=CAMNT_0013578777 /DNA_START=471 /DNA_END=749 /DNA_ORIENTATION=-